MFSSVPASLSSWAWRTGVAGHGAGALVGRIDAQRGLKDLPGLAPHAKDLEAVGPEHLGQGAALPDESHAGGDADLVVPHPLGKEDGLLTLGHFR